MSKKMPRKMRRRHARMKSGGDLNESLPTYKARVKGKYIPDTIKESKLALTDEELAKWKADNEQ